jgi:polyisoprenoid-binding protein YceI
MKQLTTLLIALLTSAFTLAQTPLTVSKASVAFKIKNAGLNVNGSFGGFQGTLAFDPANPAAGQLTASVDANSINTGINSRDNHLRKPEYFNVAQYPRISLKSTRITAKNGGTFEGMFDLTLKGRTRSVAIPFTFSNGLLTGTFQIDRRDYGVGGNSLIMGDIVTITIQVETQ